MPKKKKAKKVKTLKKKKLIKVKPGVKTFKLDLLLRTLVFF